MLTKNAKYGLTLTLIELNIVWEEVGGGVESAFHYIFIWDKKSQSTFFSKDFGGFSEPFLRVLVGLTINELHSTTSSLNFTGNAIYVGNTEDMYI